MNSLTRFIPWTIVGLAAAYLLIAMLPPHDADGEMRVTDFARLPVLEEGSRESAGRVKPYDSLARIDVMALSGLSEFKDENGDNQPAIKWLLEVMSSRVLHRRALRQNELVKIEDPRVRELLGVAQRTDIIFAFSEFDRPHLQKLVEEAIRAEKVPETQRNDFDNHVLEVTGQIQHAIQFMQSDPEYNRKPQAYKVFKIDNDQVVELLGLKPRSGFRYSIDEFAGKMKPFMDRVKKIMEDMDKDNKKVLDLYDTKIMEVYRRLAVYDKVANLQSPWAVPPTNGKNTWQPLAIALEDAEAVGKEDPFASSLEKMLVAYAQNDAKAFNKELAGYRQQISDLMPKETEKANFEFFLNHFDPFMQCMILYGIVFLLACFSWVAWPETLSKSAFWLAALTLVVHSGALFGRMYLQDRYFVFVTNLYSSAIFIGWGCVLLGLVMEAIFRNGIGIAAAAVLGFCSLFVGRYLASTSNGETMEMLQAVLDTNFWLATHVTCVTLGYMATFMAGFLGMVYLIRGVFTRTLDRDAAKSLNQMIYGTVCFATLLSFTGTVLGGIWADQSWGRFWGWDPKENGAVLIVIWNALILHARWGGMVKQRGMAVLTIIGNMITGWSWFGTNQLGAGLHAYGFSEELALGLDLFWISQLIMLGIGLVPQRYWFSYETLNQLPIRNSSATSGPKLKTKAALRH
jgi:ABC-type transport system involved in cytochrome c biogenesis permease subunit